MKVHDHLQKEAEVGGDDGSRTEAARRVFEEYAKELRIALDELRRMLN